MDLQQAMQLYGRMPNYIKFFLGSRWERHIVTLYTVAAVVDFLAT
jgi:hypothetical protein